MKISRQKLVEALSRDILDNVSRKIREIVREEIDIERKRLRRQLLEEFQERVPQKQLLREAPVSRKPFENVIPREKLAPPKKKAYTGSREIDEILNNLTPDEEPYPTDTGDGFGAAIVTQDESPEETIANFDIRRDDPTQLDWSAMMEAVDERAKEKRQSGAISLPM